MNKKLDFNPGERAESLMAGLNAAGKDGFARAAEAREEIRDLLLLSIAQSLAKLVAIQCPCGEAHLT